MAAAVSRPRSEDGLVVAIVAEHPNGKTAFELVLSERTFTVGRSDDCTVKIDSEKVSRRHLRVVVEHDRLCVADSSRNGTIAAGVFVNHGIVEVPFGAPILLGDCSLVVSPPRAIGGSPGPAPLLEPVPLAPPSAPTPPATMAAVSLASVELRREIHKRLLEHVDLRSLGGGKGEDPALRPRVLQTLRRLVDGLGDRLPDGVDRAALVGELVDEAVGLGPLERFLRDPEITEIMVVDPDTIYVEKGGRLTRANAHFTDDERVRAVIERIVTPLGRRIDESSPLVDARLKDGSRVNAVVRPIALRGSAITIRKFARSPLTLERLVQLGTLSERMARFLVRSVKARKSIVISGGTGSGKTTLLNVLSGAIPDHERIVTIEDAAELQLRQPHVVGMETRPANLEGKGEYGIRDLVKNALRMRPDRIVVGECRGGEALDMLQAMNTGHEGSMTTTHANAPNEAIARLEVLVLMSGLDLPVRAIREQIASSVDLVVQQTRFSDGSRRISAISEVHGIADDGTVALLPLFEWARTGTGADGRVAGEFRATGFLPTFLEELAAMGLLEEGEPCI